MMLEFNKKNEMIHPTTTITVLVKTSQVHEQSYVQVFPPSELPWTGSIELYFQIIHHTNL